jgi:tryptophan-rich sensory protein
MAAKRLDTVKLVLSIALPQLIGILSGLASVGGSREWYSALTKPSFTPPSWVFGPAWTLLYFMMGISLYLVWRKGLSAPGVKVALVVFLIQMGLNGLWSPLFFGMHSPCLALIDILLLWCAIAATVYVFFGQSKTAGALLVPYLSWVSFASVLNYSFWRLNG